MFLVGGIETMFEDIIKKKKKEIPLELDSDMCPYCYSLDVEDNGGVFVSSKLYVQSMLCNTCYKEWHVHYDQNLNVISIDY
jgi:transposase-like protein